MGDTDTDFDMTMDVDYVGDLIYKLEWTWAKLAAEMRINKSTMNRVVRDETRPGRQFIFRLINVFPDHAAKLFIKVPKKPIRVVTRNIAPDEPAESSEPAA